MMGSAPIVILFARSMPENPYRVVKHCKNEEPWIGGYGIVGVRRLTGDRPQSRRNPLLCGWS
jgi:hypothetical protein